MRLAAASFSRDRLAVLLALLTVVGLGAAFLFSKGTQFLMPGPLASAHGSIEKCSTCHANSGSGKLSWVHSLVTGDRHADSKACLTCHKMPETAFNAHSASADVLAQSTKRLTKIGAQTPVPQSARAQNLAFPAHDVVARGLFCSTCHQEHQGAGFKLSKISNEQCRSCHVVKFDSFDGNHPKFEDYPFKRRTRIIYDHAGHFGKHYPELAKKDPTRRIPETCSSCHNSQGDKRVMAVAPFEQTCTGCHLNQITGKERATGPKGIAFLSVPGLDLPTLKTKNAAIGEWPDASDAKLTPFMKVMIGRDERGRALIRAVDGLNLQDLANANDDQIKAVTALAWEIKGLFHALIAGKASDVLGDLNIGGGAKLSATLVADLTASIPRDVVISAQQQWLPNLAAEIASRRAAGEKQSGLNPVKGEPKAPAVPERQSAGADARQPNVAPDAPKAARSIGALPPPMRAGVGDPDKIAQADGAAAGNDAAKKTDDGEEASSEADHGEAPVKGRALLQNGTPRSIGARNKKRVEPDDADGKAGTANGNGQSRTNEGGGKDAAKGKQPEGTAAKADVANPTADAAKGTPSANKPPQGDSADQSDDLLFPTEDELRGLKTGNKEAGKVLQPGAAAAGPDEGNVKVDAAASGDTSSKTDATTSTGSTAGSEAAAATPRTRAAPVISIASDVEPESWAEYGGWYQQDYAIFYRPTGHKDKFIYSWLFLTGPQAPKGEKSAAASVFAALTDKDAQGSCTKCHSVDDIQGGGRLVNFSPPTVKSKQGRFTKFIHEPHFGIMENRGCLTCHSLEKDRPYLKSYEQGNAQSFASNFGEVKKDLCQSCHTSTKAQQDCLLCHNYHVNGAITPIMSTKLPIQ